MDSIWVCKSARLGARTRAEALAAMRLELAAIIGADNVLQDAQEAQIVPAAMPDCIVNRYEITAEGWQILTQGFAGPQGFERCDADLDAND